MLVHNKKETMNARALYIDFEKPKDINSGYGMVNWNSGYNVEFVSKINQMSSNPRNIRILTITFLQKAVGIVLETDTMPLLEIIKVNH